VCGAAIANLYSLSSLAARDTHSTVVALVITTLGTNLNLALETSESFGTDAVPQINLLMLTPWNPNGGRGIIVVLEAHCTLSAIFALQVTVRHVTLVPLAMWALQITSTMTKVLFFVPTNSIQYQRNLAQRYTHVSKLQQSDTNDSDKK
jgi:hypothetical protein